MTPNAPMTAPSAPMPPNGDTDRAAIAREVLTECARVIREEQDEPTIASRVEMFARRYAPSPTPPPIPLGAVVGYHEWTGDAWAHRLVHAPNGEARCVSPDDDLHFALTALYHARRERDAWRDDAQRYAANADFWRDRAEAAERERDAARRELAAANEWRDKAVASCNAKNCAGRERSLYDALERIRELEAAAKDQGLGASAISSRQAPNSEELDCGSAVASPAPASAPLSDPAPLSGAGNPADSGKPRRWWLNEYPHGMGYAHDTRGVADSEASSNRIACVPVVEARVTREQYEALWHDFLGYRGQLKEAFGAALTALGLTVEADHA